MHILGIDENGLGLTNQGMLGPLVVTATGFQVEGDMFPIDPPFHLNDKIRVCDSKVLFKSGDRRTSTMRSYRLGEVTSLSFLSLLEERIPDNFDGEILRTIIINKLPCQFKSEHCFFNSPLSTPLWANSIPEEILTHLRSKLQQEGIVFTYCKCALLCPKLLYKKDKYRREVYAIGQIIEDWLQNIGNDTEHLVLLGKVKNYSKSFIQKWWEHFGFSFKAINIEFVTKGDQTEFPISLSSVIGKYIREVFIERINKYFRQFDSDLPLVSGYRQNERFDEFVQKVIPFCRENSIPFSCLVRDYTI